MDDTLTLVHTLADELLATVPPTRCSPAEFRGAQYDLGLAWVHFPVGRGGLGLAPSLQAQVDRRLREAGAPQLSMRWAAFLALAGPTLVAHGTDGQLERFMRRGFSGEDCWCQLFSEPGAGSDLASLATRAVRDGDDWVVNGQKVWNSLAHLADWGILITRTDPGQPKHRGMTYFVIDMHSPGVEVRPLVQMTGEPEFNEVYLTDVRIPDACRIGAVDDGWRVVSTTLANERSMLGGAGSGRKSGGGAIGEALRIWARPNADRTAGNRQRLVEHWVEAEVLRLTMQRASQARRVGNPGPESSVGKLSFTQVNQNVYELCIDLLGAEGTVGFEYGRGDGEPMGFVGPAGSARRSFLRSRANSIEGGTSEIQRNIIGEKVLGLPGEPRTDKDLPWSDVPRS